MWAKCTSVSRSSPSGEDGGKRAGREFISGNVRSWASSSILTSLLCLVLAGCGTTPASTTPTKPKPRTWSSFDIEASRTGDNEFPAGTINFVNTDVRQVLAIYQELSGRTVISPATLPAPTVSVRNQTPLNRVQALQMLDTALAENGIAMVLAGDAAVKAVPAALAASESPPEITLPWRELPDSGSYMMRSVHLRTHRPSEVVPVLVTLTKAPNAIVPVDSSGELILRDYSSNIRRMLQVLEDLEKKSGS